LIVLSLEPEAIKDGIFGFHARHPIQE